MKLCVVLGPMFAGKSSRALAKANHLSGIGMKVLYVKPSIDTRGITYIHSGGITSDEVSIKAVNSLSELDITPYNAVILDEAQFFPDLLHVLQWENDVDMVFVAGLNTNYRGEQFNNMITISTYADEVTHCYARCSGTVKGPCPHANNQYECTAQFTKRTVENVDQVLIGGQEYYRPQCRRCFSSDST